MFIVTEIMVKTVNSATVNKILFHKTADKLLAIMICHFVVVAVLKYHHSILKKFKSFLSVIVTLFDLLGISGGVRHPFLASGAGVFFVLARAFNVTYSYKKKWKHKPGALTSIVLGLLPLALCSISTAAGLLEIW
jgi:hypothetical protein